MTPTFQPPPHLSPHPWSRVRSEYSSLRWMRTILDHGFDPYQCTIFTLLPEKGRSKASRTNWDLSGLLEQIRGSKTVAQSKAFLPGSCHQNLFFTLAMSPKVISKELGVISQEA